MLNSVNVQRADAVISVLTRAADALMADPNRRGSCVNLPARGRLLITGDLHDHPEHFLRIISLATLDRSPDHHVMLHELIHGEHLVNRMDFSYRMLVKVADLITRFPGQVHPLLANHELAQLTGRGVSKGAGDGVHLFNNALEYVFGEAWTDVDASIRRFIRAMPLALRSESGILGAHSLPHERAMKSFDPAILDRPLCDEDYAAPTGSAYLMVWGRAYTDEQVEQLAKSWGIEQFFLGHRAVETGIEMVGPRVIVLNSDHDRATVLPIDLARPPRGEEALFAAVPLQSVPLPG